ncbi:MAG: class I SAM-dependent methyltransferase [Desulfuromonadales bacterium]|nr:class I SAM-dependent methyltransferase [Desulfuromonadales bacterium]
MTERRDFDCAAAEWDEKPRRVKLAQDIADAISVALPLSRTWNAMDFGCGTGLVTLSLAPHLGSILGIDSSGKMVERLNAKAVEQGCTNARGERLDLERGELPDGRYHLITSSMTMHHIPDIVPLLSALRSLLQPGGRVALADLETEDGSFHEDLTGVFHHGFNREQFTDLLSRAGFSDISISTVTDVIKSERSYPVFLATATAS